ncbi:UNVERIFIED_CONTAM: hypothetical protein FKN15_003336 [Acipenser sinensis]
MGFKDVSADRTAVPLKQVVDSELSKYRYKTKVLSQSYDSAAVIAGHAGSFTSPESVGVFTKAVNAASSGGKDVNPASLAPCMAKAEAFRKVAGVEVHLSDPALLIRARRIFHQPRECWRLHQGCERSVIWWKGCQPRFASSLHGKGGSLSQSCRGRSRSPPRGLHQQFFLASDTAVEPGHTQDTLTAEALRVNKTLGTEHRRTAHRGVERVCTKRRGVRHQALSVEVRAPSSEAPSTER